MARFRPMFLGDILRRMAERVVARTGLTDLNTGGGLFTALGAAAREQDAAYGEMVNLQRVWSIDDAEGDDLDRRAADFNPEEIARRGSTYALGHRRFQPDGERRGAGHRGGPRGAAVGGPRRYVTTATATILNGDTTSNTVGIKGEGQGRER